jgi:hypothetical protein
MPLPSVAERRARLRQLRYLREPRLWPQWPFLPVVRDSNSGRECGLLYDFAHVSGRLGYSATVVLCNLFELPRTEEQFLALPKEVFDTPEEVYDAGWRVD